MSTDTNDLIGKLSEGLAPVKRIAPAWLRATVFSVLTIAVVMGAIALFTEGLRPDWTVMLSAHLCQSAGIFMAGVLAAVAAAILSVPDTRMRPHVWGMLGLASGIWLVVIVEQLQQGWPGLSAVGERNCLTDLVLLGVLPVAAAFFMATRAAPVWRGWAGYAMTLSACSFAALGMRFICANEEPAHLLVWHFLPVFVLALFGMGLGEILLKWKAPKKITGTK